MTNPLEGLRLRYLIGKDEPDDGRDGFVTEVGFDAEKCPSKGIGIKYCNLFDEKNSGRFKPYMKDTDVSEEYDEGVISPTGPGWEKNLREQAGRATAQGFKYVELDNPDAFDAAIICGAVSLMEKLNLKVIAKNPGLVDGDHVAYVRHPNVYGVIVERGAGNAGFMDTLRKKAGKPDLPVWFVSFGSGKSWAKGVASGAKQYRNMYVTYSSVGEYKNAAVDL